MNKEFVIYVDDHMIYSKAFGTWNENIYTAFDEAMNEAIIEVQKPFVEILDLRKWKIGTLDMINLAVERHKVAIEAGRVNHLTIAKKGAMSYLITSNHIYKRTGLYEDTHFMQFDEVETCCAYLEQKHYAVHSLRRFIGELESMTYEDADLFPIL